MGKPFGSSLVFTSPTSASRTLEPQTLPFSRSSWLIRLHHLANLVRDETLAFRFA